MNSDKSKPLTRKPSWKNRKPPEVRQTLTSKYRLLKSNPILMKAVAQDDKEMLLKQPLKTLAAAMGNSNQINSLLEHSLILSRGSVPNKLVLESGSASNLKKPLNILAKPKTNFIHSNSSKIDFTSSQLLSSTVLESQRESIKKMSLKGTSSSGAKPKLSKPSTTAKRNSQKTKSPAKTLSNKPVRRSLSAEHFDRKKKEIFNQLRVVDPQPRKSQSFVNINDKEKVNEKDSPNFSAITEEGSSFSTAPSTPKYKTPTTNDRRSFFKTPNTNNRKSLSFLTPTSNEISGKLNEWLKRREKSLGDFHHLKCFGLHGQQQGIDEENKENVEISPKNTSYENLKIPTVEKNINLEAVAKEALQDLHKLILEGYPSDQCDVWLRLIKQKYKKLEEDPQYWECRAAIEQYKGNINLAVECYKTAIIQGAEVQSVDQSLDQLLQKFSLLNINSQEGQACDRTRIIQDARNIFKSSIIQFAVQERILKTKNNGVITEEKKLVATPVRRSTRARTAYTSTPGVEIYSSLNDVDMEIRKSLTFRQNKALN